MREFLSITKALADETRVRLLMALTGGEICVCQLVELVGLAPSTVSKHLSLLKQARLVEGRKEGRWMYYRLADEEVSEVVRKSLEWTRSCLEADGAVIRDRERLDAILKMDPADLCRKQCCR